MLRSPHPPMRSIIFAQASQGKALIPPTRPESEAHGSNLVELPNGDILLAFFDGIEGEGMVAIVVARLVSGASRWEDPVVVSEQLGHSNQNPVLFFSEANQTLILLHTSQLAKKGQGTSELRELRSTDLGKTWSEPVVKIDDKGIFIRNQMLLSETGEWLLPAYYTPGGMADHKSQYSAMLRSANDGADWSTNHIMTRPNKHGAARVQPSVIRVPAAPQEAEQHGAATVEDADSDEEIPWSKLVPSLSTQGPAQVLKAFFRDREAEWVYMAKSFDDGLHWTEPKKTVLPNNDKAIQATVLRNGHVLIAFGNGQGSKAKWGPMAVALSTNHGEKWTYVRDLEDDYDKSLEYSYPSIIQDKAGRIHISYTWSYKRRRVAISLRRPHLQQFALFSLLGRSIEELWPPKPLTTTLTESSIRSLLQKALEQHVAPIAEDVAVMGSTLAAELPLLSTATSTISTATSTLLASSIHRHHPHLRRHITAQLREIDQRLKDNAIAIEVLQNTAGLTAQAVKDIAAKPAPPGLAGDAPPITTWADMHKQHTTSSSTTSAVAAQLQRQTLDLREEAELSQVQH
eukprot:jgi/Mesvir1/9257/Mv03123-RA.1